MPARAVLVQLLTKTASRVAPQVIAPPRTPSIWGDAASTAAGGAAGGAAMHALGGEGNETTLGALTGGLFANRHFRGMMNAHDLKGKGGLRAKAISRNYSLGLGGKAGLLAAFQVPKLFEHSNKILGDVAETTNKLKGDAQQIGTEAVAAAKSITGAAGNVDKVTGELGNTAAAATGALSEIGGAAGATGAAARDLGTGLKETPKAIREVGGQFGSGVEAFKGMGDKVTGMMGQAGEAVGKAAPWVAGAGAVGILGWLLQKEMASRREARTERERIKSHEMTADNRRESIIRHLSGRSALQPLAN